MSATRKSSRITKKTCINVQLNVSDGIEFVDANGFTANMDEDEKWTGDIIDEGDEELVVNPDGTMSIKMAGKSNGTKQDATRCECPKCGLSFQSDEVNEKFTSWRFNGLGLKNAAIHSNIVDADETRKYLSSHAIQPNRLQG